jgi:hypothetical protein
MTREFVVYRSAAVIRIQLLCVCVLLNTRAVCKVHGLAVLRRCYAERGGDSYAKLLWWG